MKDCFTEADRQYVSDSIRTIPDFPKKGIMFHDVTSMLLDPKVGASPPPSHFLSIIDTLLCIGVHLWLLMNNRISILRHADLNLISETHRQLWAFWQTVHTSTG